MKKVFIGLLIIAAGTAVYILLNRRRGPDNHSIQKDLIIGKWKLDTIHSLKDSSFNAIAYGIGYLAPRLAKHKYEFTSNGSIELWPKDSSTTDSRYEWIDKNQLAWKEYPANKIIEIFDVPVLSNDSMALVSKDSVMLSFIKVD